MLDERFYRLVFLRGSLGLGESYMQQYWECDDLEGLFSRLVNSGLERRSQQLPMQRMSRLFDRVFNQQSRVKSLRNAEHHYNLGNDLFLRFLGPYRNYSCGYFKEAATLEQAQLAKMRLLCEKLELKATDHLLDVGGGWGEFARFAATEYGCRVTSINIADEQIEFARQHCSGTGVEIVKKDYRDLSGSFDKIAVIAMFTHVGYKNYRSFMETLHGLLAPDGRMIMETVGGLSPKVCCEPWTNKYIFPGGLIPTLGQVDVAIDGLFRRVAVEEFGHYYTRTLRCWHENLMAAWPTISDHYSETMRRMFEYYFLSVAGAFSARGLLHYHIEFIPERPRDDA